MYVYGKSDEGKEAGSFTGFQASEFAASDWSRFEFKFEIPVQIRGCFISSVRAVLRSATGAYFDDVQVTATRGAVKGK